MASASREATRSKVSPACTVATRLLPPMVTLTWLLMAGARLVTVPDQRPSTTTSTRLTRPATLVLDALMASSTSLLITAPAVNTITTRSGGRA